MKIEKFEIENVRVWPHNAGCVFSAQRSSVMNRGLKGLFAHNELPECKLNSQKNSSIHGPFTLIFFSFVRLLKIKGYISISFLEMQLVNKSKKASKMCLLNPICFLDSQV